MHEDSGTSLSSMDGDISGKSTCDDILSSTFGQPEYIIHRSYEVTFTQDRPIYCFEHSGYRCCKSFKSELLSKRLIGLTSGSVQVNRYFAQTIFGGRLAKLNFFEWDPRSLSLPITDLYCEKGCLGKVGCCCGGHFLSDKRGCYIDHGYAYEKHVGSIMRQLIWFFNDRRRIENALAPERKFDSKDRMAITNCDVGSKSALQVVSERVYKAKESEYYQDGEQLIIDISRLGLDFSRDRRFVAAKYSCLRYRSLMKERSRQNRIKMYRSLGLEKDNVIDAYKKHVRENVFPQPDTTPYIDYNRLFHNRIVTPSGRVFSYVAEIALPTGMSYESLPDFDPNDNTQYGMTKSGFVGDPAEYWKGDIIEDEEEDYALTDAQVTLLKNYGLIREKLKSRYCPVDSSEDEEFGIPGFPNFYNIHNQMEDTPVRDTMEVTSTRGNCQWYARRLAHNLGLIPTIYPSMRLKCNPTNWTEGGSALKNMYSHAEVSNNYTFGDDTQKAIETPDQNGNDLDLFRDDKPYSWEYLYHNTKIVGISSKCLWDPSMGSSGSEEVYKQEKEDQNSHPDANMRLYEM